MKALILAAGFGSRLAPITDEIPKPLLPILNIPVIEYNIKFLKNYGIKDIFINVHHRKDEIKSKLGNGKEYGVSITWLEEKEILGTGGAIGSLREKVDGTFIVINSDTIFDFSLDDIVDYHKNSGRIATLGVISSAPEDKRAVLTSEDGLLTRMINSSIYPSLPKGNSIFTGLHVLEPEILEYIPEDIFLSITDDIYCRIIEDKKEMGAFTIKGRWWDIGTVDAFLTCSFDLLKSLPLSYFNPLDSIANVSPEIGPESLVAFGNNVKMAAVPITPPVLIGDGADLRNSIKVGPELVVGKNAVVKGDTSIEKTVYLPNAGGEKFLSGTLGRIFY